MKIDPIATAIDKHDARLAGRIVDVLRARGATYNDILELVRLTRPEVTAADWDALLAEADDLESEGG